MGLLDLSFTPSEYILLNGEKFAPEASGSNGLPLLCSDGLVNGAYLAAIIFAAAILANQEEGALEISLKQKKKLFGKSSDSSVFIRPINQPPNWSGYSLETAVRFVSGQLFAVQQENSVYNVAYTILSEDRKDPWQKIIELVEWGLASSNWLIPVEGDALAAFSIPFICPEKVRELALTQPVEPVKDLIVNCKKNQPELWTLMIEEIEQAFKNRKKSG